VAEACHIKVVGGWQTSDLDQNIGYDMKWWAEVQIIAKVTRSLKSQYNGNGVVCGVPALDLMLYEAPRQVTYHSSQLNLVKQVKFDRNLG
jgi:hypothetical protein